MMKNNDNKPTKSGLYCIDIEGQWDSEETTIEALQHRLNDGYFGRTYSYGSGNSNTFGNELKKMLDFLD